MPAPPAAGQEDPLPDITDQFSAPAPPRSGGRPVIGLDVGGTKIAGGVVIGDGEVVDRAQVPTPDGEDGGATVDALAKVVDELRDKHPDVEAIGVGAAGLVEWPSGRILWAPNNAYRDLPLRRVLHELTGLPTVVDNDATAAAWGEARFGAGAGADDMVLLTVGTGVGGGLVLGGHVYRGKTGTAFEVGHMVVDPDGATCGCGKAGCLEAMASGTALGRMGREAAEADPDGRLAQLAGGAEHVTGMTAFQAAREGDPVASELFRRLGFWLGVGIASLVTIFDLDVVVVGGGLVATGDLLLGPARESLKRFAFAPDYRQLPPVVPARLGSEAGLVGAAHLALRARG